MTDEQKTGAPENPEEVAPPQGLQPQDEPTTPPSPNPTDTTPTPPTPTAGEVSSQVSEKLNKKEEATNTADMIPFDVDKLSSEQLRVLKAKLSAQPERIKEEDRIKTIRLRSIDGNVLVDFKRAYIDLIDDPENNRKVKRHVIPVRLFSEEEYRTMLYSDFINSEQVALEVVSERKDIQEKVTGQVIHRKTGRLVDMVQRTTKQWYTVKLPSGDTVEIEDYIANG